MHQKDKIVLVELRETGHDGDIIYRFSNKVSGFTRQKTKSAFVYNEDDNKWSCYYLSDLSREEKVEGFAILTKECFGMTLIEYLNLFSEDTTLRDEQSNTNSRDPFICNWSKDKAGSWVIEICFSAESFVLQKYDSSQTMSYYFGFNAINCALLQYQKKRRNPNFTFSETKI